MCIIDERSCKPENVIVFGGARFTGEDGGSAVHSPQETTKDISAVAATTRGNQYQPNLSKPTPLPAKNNK